MDRDEHHPTPPKLIDHVEAVLEHRRADDVDPDDAAERDLIEFIRKHRDVLDDLEARIGDRDVTFYGGHVIGVSFNNHNRVIPLDPPGDGR